MKRIKLIMSEISFVLRKNLTVIIIFIICATLSTAFVLTLMSKFKDELTYLEELETYKRKYNIAILKDIVGEKKFDLEYINTLLEGHNIPKVLAFTLIEEEQYAFYVRCEFSEVLNKEQIDTINSIVKYDVYSLYDSAAKSQAIEHKFVLTILLSMFLLVAFNTLNLNRYLIRKNSYRFTIYKMCGSSNWFAFNIMYIVPLLITAGSYVIGTVLYKLFLFEFFYKLDRTLLMLNWDLIVITFFANLVFCFVLLIPSVISILKRGVV